MFRVVEQYVYSNLITLQISSYAGAMHTGRSNVVQMEREAVVVADGGHDSYRYPMNHYDADAYPFSVACPAYFYNWNQQTMF